MTIIQEVSYALVEHGLVSAESFSLREGTFAEHDCVVLECLDPPAPPPRELRSRPTGVESRYAATVAGWVAFLDAQGWDATKSPPWSPEEAHHGIVFGRKSPEDSPIEESTSIE